MRVGNGAYNQRQNDVYGAVLDSVYLHSKQRDHIPERLWPVLTDQVRCAAAGVAGARPGHLGGARRAAALRLLEADVLGGDGPRRAPGRTARRARAARSAGRRWPRRSARTSSSGAWTSAGCSASTTTPTRSTPRTCWCRWCAFCRPDDERVRATVIRDPRGADRERAGAALPHRRDRRRAAAARRARS